MAQAETRQDRKDRYHAVLRVVGHQTGGVQHPGVRPETVKLVLCAHADLSVDGVERSMRAAVENDDLVAWLDDAGNRRLTLATKEDLRRVAEYWAERDGGRELAFINACIDEVREDVPFHRVSNR